MKNSTGEGQGFLGEAPHVGGSNEAVGNQSWECDRPGSRQSPLSQELRETTGHLWARGGCVGSTATKL